MGRSASSRALAYFIRATRCFNINRESRVGMGIDPLDDGLQQYLDKEAHGSNLGRESDVFVNEARSDPTARAEIGP